MADRSNGYEAIARAFMRARNSAIGPETVLHWARRLPSGAAVLDLGCGNGVPISKALLDAGFAVHGIDASQAMVGEFRRLFPDTAVECCAVEHSEFFQRTFDGIVAWGLMFLLPEETQRVVIGKMARALGRDGELLFTAPRQACAWNDAMTGLPSVSLGEEVYAREMAAHGLVVTGHDEDAGQNYYYFARKL